MFLFVCIVAMVQLEGNLTPVGKAPTLFWMFTCASGCVCIHTHTTGYLLQVIYTSSKNSSLPSSILCARLLVFIYTLYIRIVKSFECLSILICWLLSAYASYSLINLIEEVELVFVIELHLSFLFHNPSCWSP